MKHITSILALLIFVSVWGVAQPGGGKRDNRASKGVQIAPNIQLAQEYYKNGEFEKAASLYEKLVATSPTNSYYFSRYMECLTEMEEYAKAESVLKSQL